MVHIPGGTQNRTKLPPGRQYDHTYETMPPEYGQFDEKLSDNSERNNYDRWTHTTRRKSNQQYANNTFVYPHRGIPQYIWEDKAAAVGKTFTGNLAADGNPREFYRDVRQTVMVHKLYYGHKTLLQRILDFLTLIHITVRITQMQKLSCQGFYSYSSSMVKTSCSTPIPMRGTA